MTTTTSTGIRAARVSLGNSLACSTDASADDLREAEQQFQKALSVPEDVPPTWEIMAALARLARDRQLNAPAALKWMVSAVRAAGDEVQSGLIREALKLLDDHDAPALLDSLPAEHLDWLREAAGHPAADPVLQLEPGSPSFRVGWAPRAASFEVDPIPRWVWTVPSTRQRSPPTSSNGSWWAI